ncbi:hypothetical protein HPB50_011262 [Hyalomma asiaticum]|uniref:Uncharacterized protein n=1 Tax=Hyalomma asiaticum TaxID=266040 RepID=A0ACB7RN54_HYAAI|nr:hypothetical protein HPB50_011262 [Hyalomma asiaticum]
MSLEDTPRLSNEAEVVGQGTLDIVQQSSACNIPEMSPENPPHLSSEAEGVGQGTLDIMQWSPPCDIPENPPHLSSEAEGVGLGTLDTMQCSPAGTPSDAALLARISALERQLTIAKAKTRVKEREHKKLMLHLSSYINEDQFTSLHRSPRGTVWSKETLTKALKIRLSCGSRGYDMVKELGQPLPSQRTLQRHIEHCKFRPGLLVDIMDSLAVKPPFTASPDTTFFWLCFVIVC